MKIMRFLYMGMLLIGSAWATRISVYEAGYPQNRDDNLHVKPVTDVIYAHGAYIEHQLHISFAYDFNSWFFKNYEELELEWTFQLPEEAVVYNLYCWKGDSVVRATMLDKWTALQMFDEKTSPIREPALLIRSLPTYNRQVDYTLRIFPMRRFEVNRVMIQYLVPARPSSGSLRSWLPIPQVTAATGGAKNLRVMAFYDEKPDSVAVVGYQNVVFQHYPEDRVWETTLPVRYGEYAEMVLPSPIKDEYFLSTFQKGGDTFYQLAVYPPDLPFVDEPRKILILLDYNPGNSSGLTSDLVVTSLKETLERSLTAADSVSMIGAFPDIVFGNERWLAGTQENIDQMFTIFAGRLFLNINFSQELLLAAQSFLQRNGQGEMLWITNRADFPTGTYEAQQYAHEILALFTGSSVIHVLDLENVYAMSYYSSDIGYGNRSFTFLSELTRITGGHLFFYRFHPLKTALAAIFFEKVAHYNEVEVQTRMQDGYTFDRRDYALFEGYYPMDFPIIQTGRLQGNFPMSVTVIANTLQQSVKKDLVIPAEAVQPGSDHLYTAFYGQQLQKLARRYQNNWVVNEIIALSLETGVLSPYTAFLVPDKWQSYYVPEFVDETVKGSTPVETHPVVMDSLLCVKASPNPFNPRTTLHIDVPVRGDFRVDIYNLAGQLVRRFERSAAVAGRYKVIWDATSDAGLPVTSGIYVARITAQNQVKTIRLTLLR